MLRQSTRDDDHLHNLVVDIGMRHWRAFDEQAIAFETDGTDLLAADPRLVPRDLDPGDDFTAVDAIAARIRDHGAQRLGALGVGLRHLSAFGGDEREPVPVRRRDLVALRVLAVDRAALLGLLVLVDDRDELPGSDDVLPVARVVGPRRHGGEPEREAEPDDDRSHGTSLRSLWPSSAGPMMGAGGDRRQARA